MPSLLTLTATVALSGALVHASFDNNLAYRSPSNRHPTLGVSLSHVSKRHVQAGSSLFTPAEVNFTHGVASGDPYSDSGVVPIYDHEEGAPPSDKAACVEYRVAADEGLTQVVDQGRAYTTSDVDYTVKFEATGLQPFTTYYYQFHVCDSSKTSPVGRTKTIPARDQHVDRNINLAVYSCSNFPEGYFTAYRQPALKDSVDYVLHLGDYIYEYKPSSSLSNRNPSPTDHETYTLSDYRARLGAYRTDPDLLLSHARFPWIPVWDDHEVADNSWRNGSTDSDSQVFRDRKKAAVRGYFEWMPIRQVAMDDSLRVWRGFALGTLMDVVMLDTRQYDRDVTVIGGIGGVVGGNSGQLEEEVGWANRTLMGFKQEKWFYDQLRESSSRGAAWRVVGNQVVFSRLTLGVLGSEQPFNRDQWDGYLANRDRVYQALEEGRINNTVMLSGDSHAAWVSDLAWLGKRDYDETTGDGAFGVELAGTAVTSSGFVPSWTPKFVANALSKRLIDKNPELQWQELYYRGYFEMSVGYDAIEAKFWGISDIKKQNGEEVLLAEFLIRNGENRLARNPTVGGGKAKAGALKNGKIE
ncbi:PhoD-like phosphatase-domain-containing protein [Chaetomium sp. MPI-SDFR-AT-0129]|nr:PhoD-like phosphatase-domain-containing protein [Chaetomium sp. MPI-SDFR-AT-0129]